MAMRSARHQSRPEIRGKFIFAGDEKLQVRGVTYGAFEPDGEGNEYHALDRIDRDFSAMAGCGSSSSNERRRPTPHPEDERRR